MGGAPVVDKPSREPMCIGRIIAGLPADAGAAVDAAFHYMSVGGPTAAASYGDIRSALEAERSKYAASKMKRSVRADAIYRSGGLDPDKLYGSTQLVGFDVDAMDNQVIISYHPSVSEAPIVTEVHKFINGKEYVFQTKDAGADDYTTTRHTMWNAALHFQPLSHGEVPTTPGFCVAGGMFADAGHAPLHESFTLVAKFKDHPDARFVIDANAINTPDTDEPSLKHRVDSELGILRANVTGHVGVLVRGEREAAGQKGYQIGLSVPNDTVPNTAAYKFFWSADGVPKDATRPALEVSLTIQPEPDKPASFADAKQAEALWDELLGGLRIRPGSVAR